MQIPLPLHTCKLEMLEKMRRKDRQPLDSADRLERLVDEKCRWGEKIYQ
jgi:hypothetical protein